MAQLYLIQGPIVSLPPQTFNGEFLPTGKARVVLSGKRLLTGDFELLGAIELIKEKYEPRLIRNPDSLKSPRGANTKGFAALSDGTGTELSAYMINKAAGRGDGTCADNQHNTYRIVCD